MDRVRYVLALLILVQLPPVYWLLLHRPRFVPRWRRRAGQA